MDNKEFRTYMDIAMRIGGFTVSERAIDFICTCVEEMQVKKGEMTLKDVVAISNANDDKHNKNNEQQTSHE